MVATVGVYGPDIFNKSIGKGFLGFQPEGDSVTHHLGNCPEFTVTPTLEKLEHFSSMEGIKELDDTIILSKSGSIKITAEEMIKLNLRMLMVGTSDNDVDEPKVNIFDADALTGKLSFWATNDRGPRWNAVLNRVQFEPSGGLSLIGSDLAKIELTGKFLTSDSGFGYLKLQKPAGTIAPVNAILPFVTGPLAHGSVMTAWNGGWVGAASYAYQWKKDGVAIGGETNKTYLTVVGDGTHGISVTVTATNSTGTTSATSAELAIT